MSYIGSPPQFAQFPSKFFDGDGSAMTVTLDYAPPNLAALLVFISGVRQDTSAYTLSGTSLTFTGTVPSGTNNVQVVHLGQLAEIPTPGDDTVSTAKIQDDAVTAAKLANSINTEIAANTAKVTNATHTGDVTGATALTIADDAVDIAMLSATGTASSSTFLRGDNAWASAGMTSSGSAPGSPSAGDQWWDSTNKIAYVSTGTSWIQMGAVNTASGGTETTYTSGGSSYKVHSFTTSGTFTVTVGGGKVDFIIAAGGGGTASPIGGGGGGGGLVELSDQNINAGTYAVVIGAGGSGTTTYGGNGGDSTFMGHTATGGGGGGGGSGANSAGRVGGSAGGASGYDGSSSASANQTDTGFGPSCLGQGYGNDSGAKGGSYYAGGGGGSAEAGEDGNGTTTNVGGVGGDGRASTITGASVNYCGGGGGGGWTGGSPGNGGVGGAGGGGTGGGNNNSDTPTAGTANTGGGGGGGNAAGGSGIVIIAYKTA